MKFGTMHLQFSKIFFSSVVKQKLSSCGKNPWVLRGRGGKNKKKSGTKPIHRMTDDGCGVSLKSLWWSDPPIPIRPDDGWGVRATYTHPSDDGWGPLGGSGFVYYESIKWEVKVWLTSSVDASVNWSRIVPFCTNLGSEKVIRESCRNVIVLLWTSWKVVLGILGSHFFFFSPKNVSYISPSSTDSCL